MRISRSTRVRLKVLLLVGALSVILAACLAEPANPGATQFDAERVERRDGVDLVVVLGPEHHRVADFLETLRSELADSFDVMGISVPPESDANKLHQTLDLAAPRLVVVIDNPTVASYRNWVATRRHPPASVLVMSAFVAELQPTVPNSVAIAYETPAVTTMVGMRTLLRRPVERVGILHRAQLGHLVERQRALLAREKIEALTEAVSSKPSVDEVKRGLRRLWRRGADSLWVMNDNALLTRRLLSDAWLPFAERRAIPIAVGVPSLIGQSTQFGVYAAAPDLEALAVQTADLVFDLSSGGYRASGQRVLPPFSTRVHVDWRLAKRLGAPGITRDEVDVVVGAPGVGETP